ncbi:MAG TPA: universal stress protein [Streptosporangiaceae bacterium]|nr:universal stress protein [Streptosporangiaceae bacterium]
MSEVARVRRIVVGVNGSEASIEALRWAVREAYLTSGELTVVHAWLTPATLYPAPYAPARARMSSDEACERAGAELTAAVSQVFGPNAADKPREVLKCGPPAQVLLDEAADADLLVLGGHRCDTPLRHTAGAIVAACLRRAPCPVVVVSSPLHPKPAV